MRYPYILIDSDDPFERGVQYGVQAAEQICIARDYYRKVMEAQGKPWDTVLRFARRYAEKIWDFGPELMKEIRGIADGAGLSEEEILVINLRYEIAKFGSIPECTTGVVLPEASTSGTSYSFKNWDFSQGVMPHLLVLHIVTSKVRILGLTEAGQLIRDGFTSVGLSVGTNNLQSVYDHAGFGIPVTLLRRKVLMSLDFASARRIIQDAPRTVSNNILLTDGIYGRAVDFEWHPRGADQLYPVQGILTHANHFVLHPELDALKNRPRNRDARLRELLMAAHGRIDVPLIRQALSDHKYYPLSICAHPDPEGGGYLRERTTVSSMSVDVSESCAWICAGPPCEGEYIRYRL